MHPTHAAKCHKLQSGIVIRFVFLFSKKNYTCKQPTYGLFEESIKTAQNQVMKTTEHQATN